MDCDDEDNENILKLIIEGSSLEFRGAMVEVVVMVVVVVVGSKKKVVAWAEEWEHIKKEKSSMWHR